MNTNIWISPNAASNIVWTNAAVIITPIEPPITVPRAPPIAAAKVLRKYANTFKDKRQLVIKAYADALEQLPLALAKNAGMDIIDVSTELIAAQEKSTNMGVNVIKREVRDMKEDHILESQISKKEMIDSCTEIAVEILRIDDVVASRPETPVGGDMPGTPNPYM